MKNIERIISALEIMRRNDLAESRHFQAVAYQKAIQSLRALAIDDITSVDDVKGVKGIGEKIRLKIEEILSTGQLAAAQRVLSNPQFSAKEDLLKIYGVGPAKAKALMGAGILSIPMLREKVAENPELLTAAQRIGLSHYEDLLLRIPREEMQKHESIVLKSLEPGVEATIVGSYRRGAVDSGDIDVLLQGRSLKTTLGNLQRQGYITNILALGASKCMCVAKLPGCPTRRLDLLCIPADEYPYAILYFTGYDTFNVAFRSHCLTRGYTLNEHGLKPTGDQPVVPLLRTEKDIFDFVGLAYVEPTQRVGASAVTTK